MKKNPRARRPANPPAPDGRSADIVGISLVALAFVLLVALALNNGGLLGDSLAALFRLLFGQGAWVTPLACAIAGVSLLFGHARFQPTRVTWGTLLVFFGLLAGLARPDQAGDYFTEAAMSNSGGYLGAVFGWALTGLLGGAKIAAVVALIAIGAVLCFDQPVREIIARLAPKPRDLEDEEPIPNRQRAPIEAKASPKERQAARREAVVRMLEGDNTTENPEATPTTKKRPILRDLDATPEFVLDNTNPAGPRDGYMLPSLDLLAKPAPAKKRDPREVQKNIEVLEDTLEQFNIEANVTEVATGPTITRYEIALGAGIKVSRIKSLADNIALSLAASHLRVEAPIPGKSAIGIEIPTAQRQMVTLREMVDSLEFHDQTHKLTVALGKDVSGVAKYTDLARMPHLLVAGATNSGKSICLASLIMSLILKMTPKDCRLVMIDPKRVELTLFEGLPHLMCPVVKDVKEAAGVLRAVVREMDRRYDKLSSAGVRNIDGWNEKASFQDRLPYIVVIIDELADLMMQCRQEVEHSIGRLTQLARATGIHLVIATQRPSVDVITGTIKNNVSSRIAFAVSSGVDSRTILDTVGAEDLIGKGDMLFLPIDAPKPVRIQGCYVSEKEIADVCEFWRAQGKPVYTIKPEEVAIPDPTTNSKNQDAQTDDLWPEAVRFVTEKGQASTSLLQRRFSIGFQRASRLLDLMEDQGVVGQRDGSRPREVLIDPIQAETLLGNPDFQSPLPEGAYLDDE